MHCETGSARARAATPDRTDHDAIVAADLGMVRQWQEMFYGRRYSAVEHPCPDWAAVAESFGAVGMRVFERSELQDALKAMLDCDGPVVMHVHVDPDENVYAMVADVVKIGDFTEVDCVERDLMLCRVQTPPEKRSEVVELVNLFRGRVVDVAQSTVLSGNPNGFGGVPATSCSLLEM